MTGLAQIYIEQGANLKEAKALIGKALKADPEDARVFMARALLNKADLSPTKCVSDLERALEIDPDLLEAKLILALIESGENNLENGLAHLTDAMRGLGHRRELLSGVVDVAVMLAQRGMAVAVLDAIRKVEAAEYLEPLCVALELSLGGKPRVAKEVLEVANDIHRRIANLTE